MYEFEPTEGFIIDGKTLSEPRWHDWGVCVDSKGNATSDLPDSVAGKQNFCAAVPPMIKYGKDAAARRDFPENGTTFIGFRADGTPVISICPRRLPCRGVTSQQAVRELQTNGCIHVLRFDGSWSSQGDLGNGVIRGDKYRTVYSLMLIYDRNKKPKTENQKPFNKSVCLDAGHYTGCPNGNSKLNYKEDEFVLDMSKRVGKLLERCGIKVYQTRKGDEYVGLTARSTFANSIDDLDLFVSLHSNANPKKSCDGFGIYTYGAGENNFRNVVANAIIEFAKTAGVKMWGNGLFYNRRLSVLRKTKAPAILIEHGFHSNTTECKLLKSSTYRDKLAEIDAKGICKALKVAWVSENNPSKPEDHSPSTDNVTSVHQEGVEWCEKNGITDGSRPHDVATREEVCTMIYRLQNKIKENY